MDKKLLKQKGFKHDIIHNEWYYERNDVEGKDNGEGKIHWFGTREDRIGFKPNDIYRCEFLQNGKRIGKIHYDAIRFIYDRWRTPTLEIFIQGGIRMHINKNNIDISDLDSTEDSNYLHHLTPAFDMISFYGGILEMDIPLTTLKLK